MLNELLNKGECLFGSKTLEHLRKQFMKKRKYMYVSQLSLSIMPPT